MTYLYNPNKVIIHAGWREDDFIIWGEQKHYKKYATSSTFKYPFLYSAFDLKLALFKHDPSSFYGTFIQTEQAVLQVPLHERMLYSLAGTMRVYQATNEEQRFPFPIEGIVLKIEQLPAYYRLFVDWLDSKDWVLSYELNYWISLFIAINKEIKNGHFLPTEENSFTLTFFPFDDWYKALPRASFSIYRSSPFIKKEADSDDKQRLHTLIQSITTTFIRFFITSDPNVEQAYQTLVQHRENKQVLLEDVTNDEGVPFKTGIFIQEPKNINEPWQLSLFVQDKQDPTMIVFLTELQRGNHPWLVNPIPKVKKDLFIGAKKVPLLSQFSLTEPEIFVTQEDAFQLLTNDYSILTKLHFTIIAPPWSRKKEGTLQATLLLNETDYSTIRWKELAKFDYRVAVNDVNLTEEEFLNFVRLKEPFIRVHGKWIYWDIDKAEKLLKQLENKRTSMSYMQAWQLSIDNHDDQEPKLRVHWSEKIAETLKQLYEKNIPLKKIPARLNGELRPYQQEGMSWLLHMRKIGFGACLADDMGLGKSVQTIAYLLSLLEKEQQAAPFLLICPTSLLGNWHTELKRFAPHLNVVIHHGNNRLTAKILRESRHTIGLVLTSYSLAYRDIDLLTAVEWDGLVLDEAQQVKNVETKQRKAIKTIKAKHRIALTGTPIENRLTELWSIIDLLNDNYLGSYKQFQSTFVKAIEKENDEKRLQQLQQLIAPFLLRRKKSDPNLHLQLPEKHEQTYYVGLTIEQATLYKGVIEHLFSTFEHLSVMERRAMILSSLTKLKQICNHPAHFLKESGPLSNRSEKWELLLTLVDQITAREEKVLIFTQYKEMGHLLQKGLAEHQQKEVLFLHGSLPRKKREQLIETFRTEKNNNIFILSLKAGGVGLNLTAANHVIHYDRWWNPAVENQATDRVYRIGQTENVTVHTFIAKGTLEEKINDLLLQKQQLADTLLLSTANNNLTELSLAELKNLLGLTNM